MMLITKKIIVQKIITRLQLSKILNRVSIMKIKLLLKRSINKAIVNCRNQIIKTMLNQI